VARTLLAEQADHMDDAVFNSIVDICGEMHSAVRIYIYRCIYR